MESGVGSEGMRGLRERKKEVFLFNCSSLTLLR